MAISVRDLYKNNEKYFQLKLIVGEEALDYKCTWVHLMEDASISKFFWGNELVVTSGLLMPDDDKFIESLKALNEKDCVGVVVNIGPYISELSDKVINFCREIKLPLFTMPWDRSMTEFTKACCSQITRSIVDDERLAEAIVQVARSPEEHVSEIETLSENFNAEEGIIFLSADINLEKEKNKYLQENRLRIGTAMRGYSFPFLIFRYERHYIIFFNTDDEKIAKEAADKIFAAMKSSYSASSVEIGIGAPVTSFEKLGFALSSAQAARRYSGLKNEPIKCFSEIGFIKLFYSVSDPSVLENYYKEMMDPLISYEEASNKEGIFIETFFRYILTDCSIKEVARTMYVHENTILYRMNKIRDILGSDLTTFAERQPYLMAYYCGLVLSLIPNYL